MDEILDQCVVGRKRKRGSVVSASRCELGWQQGLLPTFTRLSRDITPRLQAAHTHLCSFMHHLGQAAKALCESASVVGGKRVCLLVRDLERELPKKRLTREHLRLVPALKYLPFSLREVADFEEEQVTTAQLPPTPACIAHSPVLLWHPGEL